MPDKTEESDLVNISNEKKAGKANLVPVSMRGGLFMYFANGLAPIYTEELRKHREEGSFQGIEDFKKSEFGSLMTRILDKFESKTTPPETVVLELSQKDLDLILEKIPEPEKYDQRRIYGLMRDELVGSFKNARLGKASKNWAKKILGRVLEN